MILSAIFFCLLNSTMFMSACVTCDRPCERVLHFCVKYFSSKFTVNSSPTPSPKNYLLLIVYVRLLSKFSWYGYTQHIKHTILEIGIDKLFLLCFASNSMKLYLVAMKITIIHLSRQCEAEKCARNLFFFQRRKWVAHARRRKKEWREVARECTVAKTCGLTMRRVLCMGFVGNSLYRRLNQRIMRPLDDVIRWSFFAWTK